MPTRPINNATVIKDIRVVMGLELEKLSCRDERHLRLVAGARDCRAATARGKIATKVTLIKPCFRERRKLLISLSPA